MKFAIKFFRHDYPSDGWSFGIENGEVKTYDSKEDAQKTANAFQALFPETHQYEVVEYKK